MDFKSLALKILKEAEAHHVNLYHDVSKKTIMDYIESVKWEEVDNTSFDHIMLKLFNMFKDGHTFYNVNWIYLDNIPLYIQKELYIKVDNKYKKVTKVGGMTCDKFLKEMSLLSTYETEEYMHDSIKYDVRNGYCYQMLKVAEGQKVNFLLEDGTQAEVNFITKEEATERNLTKKACAYEFKILEDEILYVIYRRCMDSETYPFASFMKEIKKSVEQNKIKNYILDLRDNHGGNSEVLNPFQEYVKENNMQGVLLINNGTFSSGRHAVARFRKEFNTPMIGEGTGGAAKSYGWNKNLKVEDKSFGVSTTFFDLSDNFGEEGSIQPDIYIATTLEDIEAGRDSQLDEAIEFIKKEVRIIE